MITRSPSAVSRTTSSASGKPATAGAARVVSGKYISARCAKYISATSPIYPTNRNTSSDFTRAMAPAIARLEAAQRKSQTLVFRRPSWVARAANDPACDGRVSSPASPLGAPTRLLDWGRSLQYCYNRASATLRFRIIHALPRTAADRRLNAPGTLAVPVLRAGSRNVDCRDHNKGGKTNHAVTDGQFPVAVPG